MAGDVWLFSRGGLFNRLVQIKTWSRFSHCEAVIWNNFERGPRMIAARAETGVGYYHPDTDGLALIVRPMQVFDRIAAVDWACDQLGQGYDYAGLLNFYTARSRGNNHKMFCSELVTRFLRRGRVDPFPGADADCIAPSQFACHPLFQIVWRSPAETERHLRQMERDSPLPADWGIR